MSEPTDQQLYDFIVEAAKNTYPVDKPVEVSPQRPDFTEITYAQGELTYRDSYTAGERISVGTELVRYKGTPIWFSNYGGGIVLGAQDKGKEIIRLLKDAFAMRDSDPSFRSFRGPKLLVRGVWKYTYSQTGDITDFAGNEKIFYEDQLVFYHRIFGGRLI